MPEKAFSVCIKDSVFIDPPYNTGNKDFIYDDAFVDKNDCFTHSKWLSFMEKRLKIARRLLSGNGVIFISIDDREEAGLRLLCDEIFGENCFVSNIAWQRNYSARNDSKGIVTEVEHLLVYSRSESWSPKKLPRTAEMDAKYKNPDNDFAMWRTDNAYAADASTHQGMVYAIQHPFTGKMLYPSNGSHWRYSQEVMLTAMRGWCEYELRDLGDSQKRAEVCGVPEADVRSGVQAIVLSESLSVSREKAQAVYNRGQWPKFFFTKGGKGGIARKTYLTNVGGKLPTNLWLHSDVGHTDEAKKELISTFNGKVPFDTPKPTRLIERILQIASNDDSLILDFFAGSGTTGKAKMDKYIHGSNTKLLSDIMSSGFEENDACFINWEKLTKKGNNALKDSERTNFVEHIQNAIDNGLTFTIIVDESHQNDTIKADDILALFNANKIIRCSATPKNYKNALLIEIPEEDVIAEGLIKKLLIINENFEQHISVEDQISYLLDKALEKQRDLRAAYAKKDSGVNPLIIVQLPNKSDALLDRVEEYFESKGITYENNLLSVWLSDKKQNLEDIEDNDATPIAVIIKQAVATGWDCPRAQILVKLRDNMSEVFEIQTIGRIRRMPEAKHYGEDLLDCCYLYTLDEKFTESVKLSLGTGALDAYKVFLKPEYRSFTLISQYKTDIPFPRDAKFALKVICKFFEKKYHTATDLDKNQSQLEAYGYSFDEDIVDFTKSGSVSALSKDQITELNDISIHEPLNTHKHGKEYHHCVAEIGYKANLDYSSTNTIMRKLFLNGVRCDAKILRLETRNLYAFIINNERRLIEDVRDAMADESLQLTLAIPRITEKPVGFPLEMIFTYDGTSKSQMEYTKNVYTGYLSSAEKRSMPEKLFERFCEGSGKVKWFYKNGDKGSEYFSIVYTDNFGKQKSFYPDYVVGTNDGDIWIIETKGGFTKSGSSEDIDRFTAKKFGVLRKYLDGYNLQGGIVRQDKQSGELCICVDKYSDNIHDENWQLLSEVL